MGGFLLWRRTAAQPEPPAATLAVFAQKGLPAGPAIAAGEYTLHLFNKRLSGGANIYRTSDGFAAAVGTLFYGDLFGTDALAAIFADASVGTARWGELSGNYCLFVFHATSLVVATDLTGLYPVYCDAEKSRLSSSFLALARALRTRTPNVQEIYEYTFHEAVYGNRTLLSEVERLDPGRRWTLLPEVRSETQVWPRRDSLAGLSREDVISRVTTNLETYFSRLQRHFGDRISSAISGGYDSRLILALLRRAGSAPYLYVYGKDTNADVRVARVVAAESGLPLEHVDRSNWPQLEPEPFAQRVRESYAYFDGLGQEFGVFDDGRDLGARLDRAKRVQLQLNGGGGEIYRNFWKLPAWNRNLADLIRTRFDTADFSPCTSVFRRDDYLYQLASKARTAVDAAGRQLRRDEIELLYPLLRLRYWQAKNNLLNNQLTYALTPFAESQFAIPASVIPIHFKNHGCFEAALIERTSPALARLTSVYGHHFASRPPLKKRLLDYYRIYTPAPAVSWAKRRRARRLAASAPTWQYCHEDRFMRPLVGAGDLAVREWFDLDRIHDSGVLARVLTVELLLRGF